MIEIYKLIPFLIVIFLLQGCGQNNTHIIFDENAIINIITDNSAGFFSYYDYYRTGDTSEVEYSKAEKYIFWWRESGNSEKSINIDIIDDSACVEFMLDIEGVFNLLVSDTFPPRQSTNYPKEIRDSFIRLFTFRNFPDSTDYRGWRLEGISGVSVNSKPFTVGIDSIGIDCGYESIIISNPLDITGKNDILSLSPGETCSLTVYSRDNAYAFLHSYGVNEKVSGWYRKGFCRAGSSLFTAVWNAPVQLGLYTIAFDLINKKTIDDNEYSYDSNVWVILYRVSQS